MSNYLENVVILQNKQISDENYLLVVKSNHLLNGDIIPKSGQFYMIKMKDQSTILRRPISLHSFDKESGTVQFYYKIVGKGTKELSTYIEGDILDIQGPIGTGFTTSNKNKKIVVIGGGIGLAPLKQLINDIKNDNEILLIAGARNKDEIAVVENFEINKDDNVKIKLCTDDGSVGGKKTTVDILNEYLNDVENKVDAIYSCGPHGMLEAVKKIADKYNIKCELSLEERMACGVRACVGCSIETTVGMKKVCHDGPVFDASIIKLSGKTSEKIESGCSCECK